MSRQLRVRRIAVLATEGFEKVELTIPVAALRAAGAEVDIVSLRGGAIRGVNLHEPANKVHVTKVTKANPADYDGLLVPGGFINPDMLRQWAEARDFNSTNKPIATLCHGPWVLASAGLLDGSVLTSWPGVRDHLVNAGATWLDQQLVWDGNLVTSRAPHHQLAVGVQHGYGDGGLVDIETNILDAIRKGVPFARCGYCSTQLPQPTATGAPFYNAWPMSRDFRDLGRRVAC